jgi:hypothetical protein
MCELGWAWWEVRNESPNHNSIINFGLWRRFTMDLHFRLVLYGVALLTFGLDFRFRFILRQAEWATRRKRDSITLLHINANPFLFWIWMTSLLLFVFLGVSNDNCINTLHLIIHKYICVYFYVPVIIQSKPVGYYCILGIWASEHPYTVPAELVPFLK